MITVDGRAIRDEIQHELKREVGFLALRPQLALVLVGNDPASRKFVAMKQKFGEEIGVECILREYPETVTTEQLVEEISGLNRDPRVNGIVVQLPLPKGVDVDQVVLAIHPAKDADALRALEEEQRRVLPPVAGAVAEILERNGISPEGKRAVVVGYGRLVGKPVAQWLVDNGARLRVVEEHTDDSIRADALRNADILVAGAGVPGLITPEMVKDGVVLIDAGTSEAEGKLVGDIDPRCAEKASLFTPVPGGVGPITVSIIFKNLLSLIGRQSS